MSLFEKAKRAHHKLFLLIFSLLFSFCLIAGVCQASNNHSTGACLPVFSIKVQKKPLLSVVKEISGATGYDIKINTPWKNVIVTVTLSNVNIEEGLKIIFRKAGIKSHAFLVDATRKVIIIYTFPESANGQVKDLTHTGMWDFSKAETILPPPEEILRVQNLKNKTPTGTVGDIPPPPGGILNLKQPEAKTTHEDAETIPPPSEEILRARHSKEKSGNESIGDIPSPPEEILNLRDSYSTSRLGGEATIPRPPEEILNKRTCK